MTNFGITSDQATTLFGSLNSSLSGTSSSLYDIAASATSLKIHAKYYAKGMTNDKYAVDRKLEAAEKTEIKQDALDLKASLASLTTKGKDSVFNQYVGKADDNEVVKSARIKDGTSTQAKDFDINVKQLATSQQNVGNQLASNEKVLETGTYSLKVEIAGKTHTVNYKVESGDTNISVQKKIASALNDKNIGINAKVNTVDDKSYLSIESKDTGKTAGGSDVLFKISGTGPASADAVDKFGLDNVTRKAQNAVYSVNNGADIESRSNNIKLSNGVELEVAKVSSGNVKVSFEVDKDAVTSAVKSFVSNFNNLMFGSEFDKVSQALSSLSKSNKSALSKIGLEVSKTGEIKIDEEKLKQASASQIKDVFNSSYSFGGNVNKKLTDMISSPQRFMDDLSAYKGVYDMSGNFDNQYSGSLFDYLF